jgi:hypothetical protein
MPAVPCGRRCRRCLDILGGRVERLARLGELELLEAVRDQDRHLLSLEIELFSGLPEVFRFLLLLACCPCVCCSAMPLGSTLGLLFRRGELGSASMSSDTCDAISVSAKLT